MKNQNIPTCNAAALRAGTFTAVILALGALAFVPQILAVSPPPDGCYPGLTTAEGCSALFNLTTGQGNTALGADALFSDTTGSFNTALGAVALGFNNADLNTAVGTAAILLNNTGTENVAVGAGAMVYNDGGIHNTAVGAFALFSNTGAANRGSDNTAIGYQALFTNNGDVINSGAWNTATGSQALYSNTIGRFNSAFGYQALFNNDIGENNSAFGYRALHSNQSFGGGLNSAFGVNALLNNIDGNANSAFGNSTLLNNVHGNNNTAIGLSAGVNITGNGNVCIGVNALGEAGVDNSTYIRNVNTLAQPIGMGTDGVTVRLSDGRLGHGVSSRRYKQHIQPMDKASEALFSLKPVIFHYNKEIDPAQTLDFGLIAEEVAEVNPELAVRDGEGKISNYRRDAINAMLLNEFLKEHRKVQELQSQLSQQQKQIEFLSDGLRKVTAQLETIRPVPQMVVNDR